MHATSAPPAQLVGVSVGLLDREKQAVVMSKLIKRAQKLYKDNQALRDELALAKEALGDADKFEETIGKFGRRAFQVMIRRLRSQVMSQRAHLKEKDNQIQTLKTTMALRMANQAALLEAIQRRQEQGQGQEHRQEQASDQNHGQGQEQRQGQEAAEQGRDRSVSETAIGAVENVEERKTLIAIEPNLPRHRHRQALKASIISKPTSNFTTGGAQLTLQQRDPLSKTMSSSPAPPPSPRSSRTPQRPLALSLSPGHRVSFGGGLSSGDSGCLAESNSFSNSNLDFGIHPDQSVDEPIQSDYKCHPARTQSRNHRVHHTLDQRPNRRLKDLISAIKSTGDTDSEVDVDSDVKCHQGPDIHNPRQTWTVRHHETDCKLCSTPINSFWTKHDKSDKNLTKPSAKSWIDWLFSTPKTSTPALDLASSSESNRASNEQRAGFIPDEEGKLKLPSKGRHSFRVRGPRKLVANTSLDTPRNTTSKHVRPSLRASGISSGICGTGLGCGTNFRRPCAYTTDIEKS
ncbi:hypothetical protein AAMO2058_001645100 [Amorphochlora amoebiformis]